VDVQAYLSERKQLVDDALERALPPADAAPASLHAAMRHLLFPGGKRLRPAFAFAAAEALGAPPERALPVAVAAELVHTYSLVHDDLPCMDDDDERRGRPTVHVAFGEAVAVLAGDALLAAAFEALARAPGAADSERRLAALGDLAEAAGSRWLVGGQADDLAFDRRASAAAVESVHLRKTGALIAACAVGGGRLAGGDAAALRGLRRYGERVGVAFQITDDRLDGESDEACSLVRVLGADAAGARAEQLLGAALEAVEPFGVRAGPLRELARFAVWRDR
jgi:geranylgeranyl diphosphate synthase type II